MSSSTSTSPPRMQASEQLKDFYAGVELTLESMLISPEVLFIVETER